MSFSDLTTSNYVSDGEDDSLKATVEAKASGAKGLHVIAEISSVGGGVIPSVTKLVYADMNVANGGIARGTAITVDATWYKTYEYSGSGYLFGFLTTVESKDNATWLVRLVVDTHEVFGSTGISLLDLASATLYNTDPIDPRNTEHMGVGLFEDTFRWNSPTHPMRYDSNIKIYVRKIGVDKIWRAGLVCLTKE
jgi:hypothetical protein